MRRYGEDARVIRAVLPIMGIALIAVAIWKFVAADWTSRRLTRRSGATTNWQNEGYMANQDGKSWSEIDGTIDDSAPPARQTGSGI